MGIQVDNPVQVWMGELFQVSRDGLMEYVIKYYKRTYQQNYMQAIAKDLKECPMNLKPEMFVNEKALISAVDLYCVLKLMIEHWDRLFQGTKLRKIPGREYAQNLKRIRNAWAHQQPVSIDDACLGAEAALQLLSKLPESQKFIQRIDLISQALSGDITSESESSIVLEIEKMNEKPIENNLLPASKIAAAKVDFQIFDSDSQTDLIEPLQEAGQFYIEVVHGSGQTRCEPVHIESNRLVIGRGVHSNIQISDPRISRAHLMLTPNGSDGLKIVDLHSANGTKLEGQPIKPNECVHWMTGMSVMIGGTWLILRRGQM
jgi:HEPN superfamily Swt1-like protein/FHA domain-containing protein